MGKASSSKKIKRVQQAGVSRAPGQRRNMGYPVLIAAILVVGSVMVFFARDERAATAGEAPAVNRDHWHAAFGIDICGEFLEPLTDQGPDTMGIHTHRDGLIHIHPFVGAAAGPNAVFGRFSDQVGLEITDDSFTLPDGTTYTDGDDCETDDGTQPGRVALYAWPPAATEVTEPTIITENIKEHRFRSDGEAYVLAFVPEDAEVLLPPTLPALADPVDIEQEPLQGSTDYVDGDLELEPLDLDDLAPGELPEGADPEANGDDGEN